MGKQAHQGRLTENEAMAIGHMLRVSPRKLNLVAEMIRNRPAAAAIADLGFSKRRIARDVRKVLQSAVANAENNHQLDVDRLVVTEASVGKAMVMRRFHARGRGRSAQVEKLFSNITIVVREQAEEKEKKAEPAKAAAKSGKTAGKATSKGGKGAGQKAKSGAAGKEKK